MLHEFIYVDGIGSMRGTVRVEKIVANNESRDGLACIDMGSGARTTSTEYKPALLLWAQALKEAS